MSAEQVQAMQNRINGLVLDVALRNKAIKDLVRLCEAVRYTSGLSAKQMERVNEARALLTSGKSND